MKMDIESRKDIIKMVDCFYDKVKKDELIGFFFKDVVLVDWNAHLPKMYDFWESVILHTGDYNGNPMQVHKDLSQKHSIEKLHFERWLLLFTNTIDELFEGTNAEMARQRALSIATVMQLKVMKNEGGMTIY
jgi:hemoglobin